MPSKRELIKENSTVSIAIIDVTEQETERPKPVKDQLVIDGETGQIIGVYEEKGSVHDLEIFKRSGYHCNRNKQKSICFVFLLFQEFITLN
ncbi:MAG: hypothetical protein FWC41_10320 [Firmicutes bacterium]|nr:hypothetical protein [Bacillota bacterium]